MSVMEEDGREESLGGDGCQEVAEPERREKRKRKEKRKDDTDDRQQKPGSMVEQITTGMDTNGDGL